jgi:phenylacetate-CoA ligase
VTRKSFFRRDLETAERETLKRHQLDRLRSQVSQLWEHNRFYTAKLRAAGFNGPGDLSNFGAYRGLPFTTKAEVAQDQIDHPPFGSNLTYPLERYVKLHQTSGTSGGRPIRWLDTAESWDWWAECWSYVYRGAGVEPGDRVFFAFSFGPFIGFWSAYEGAGRVGAMTIPGGGQDSLQRLQSLLAAEASVLVCTPTYALRLAEVAREHRLDLSSSAVRVTIHAGEPGASIPATRRKLEESWGADCHDHTGLTEVGATGFTCQERSGVHLIESEFIFEVVDPASGATLPAGRRGELVVSNLGRVGMPLLRYRTGDLVELDESPCSCGRTFARMRGGVLGRADDMLIVRGVNVFPSAIEDVVREFEEVQEFRIQVANEGPMAELRLLLEVDHGRAEPSALARQVAQTVQQRLLLRVDCICVEPGSLPRFELKAHRLERVSPSPFGRGSG